jgi:putative oxidoreductase
MSVDLGILLIRVLFGAAIAAHGAQKVFGSFGGYGLRGTGGFFETVGFKPGVMFAAMAGLSELLGGLLVALGLLTPLGAAMVLAAMIVAMVGVHLKNGYAAAALGVAFTGGGAYSLDALLGLRSFADPYIFGGLLLLTIIGAGLTLAVRRHAQPRPAVTQE